jgi:hypothetical protein
MPRWYHNRSHKNILWKKLIKLLNSKKEHRVEDIENACRWYFSMDAKVSIEEPYDSYKTYGSYMRFLEKYKFLYKRTVTNQNGQLIKKIIMNKKISKKVQPDLIKTFEEQPWLAWFMFPE